MKTRHAFPFILAAVVVLVLLTTGLSWARQASASPASPQVPVGTGFTFQGYLTDGGAPANGIYDFNFELFDAETNGVSYGEIYLEDIEVSNGLFSVTLDFGSGAFNGEARWLKIRVRPGDETGVFIPLVGRQLITPSPYALALPGLWTQPNATSPNLIGGYFGNWITAEVYGATIGGGGESGNLNRVTDLYGTVGGGANNQAGNNTGTIIDNAYATVGGGYTNIASGWYATVGGGNANAASSNFATISGGAANTASNFISTVSGGYGNIASGNYATVSGGIGNTANTAGTEGATVSGGIGNTASGDYAIVSGGAANTASGYVATVSGGYTNTASTEASTISGGIGNTTNGDYATIGGGYTNTASGYVATVSGGYTNTASTEGATVSGGTGNTASGDNATVSGGTGNIASGDNATVGGGAYNTASNTSATVGGGAVNIASDTSATVGGGVNNVAMAHAATIGGGRSNTATGWGATIPGGDSNEAHAYAFAAGNRAKAYNKGCFVWGDSTEADVTCDDWDQWVARASGGVTFYTNSNLTSGVKVNSGGNAWSTVSDRNLKENFEMVDSQALLASLAQVPVTTWNYKSQDDAIRHIGPMAQDFYAAFGVGDDDTHISTIDPDGVALAAIQGLYAENQRLKAENATQDAQIEDLVTRLIALELVVKTDDPAQSSVSLSLTWLLVVGLALTGGTWMAPRQRRNHFLVDK
jgi:hypothetical protein